MLVTFVLLYYEVDIAVEINLMYWPPISEYGKKTISFSFEFILVAHP